MPRSPVALLTKLSGRSILGTQKLALDILNGTIANIPVESETESRRKHYSLLCCTDK